MDHRTTIHNRWGKNREPYNLTMAVRIERILNQPVDSNCWVIYFPASRACAVVDPGSKEPSELMKFLKNKDLIPEYILLTHEHFDHIWGVNYLKDNFDARIVCSSLCSKKLPDRKKNMSVFYDQVGFETYAADIVIGENTTLIWQESEIRFIETPGHTDCSVCILMNDSLFTGDSLILNNRTVTKFPTGNQTQLIASLEKIFSIQNLEKITGFPGHGEKFFLRDCEAKNFY